MEQMQDDLLFRWFVGLGIRPPLVSLGQILGEGQSIWRRPGGSRSGPGSSSSASRFRSASSATACATGSTPCCAIGPREVSGGTSRAGRSHGRRPGAMIPARRPSAARRPTRTAFGSLSSRCGPRVGWCGRRLPCFAPSARHAGCRRLAGGRPRTRMRRSPCRHQASAAGSDRGNGGVSCRGRPAVGMAVGLRQVTLHDQAVAVLRQRRCGATPGPGTGHHRMPGFRTGSRGIMAYAFVIDKSSDWL